MISLEHLNLVVNNIEKSLQFYRAAFPHWSVRGRNQDEWHGKPRHWLHFGDDYQYLSFNDNGVGENRDLTGHQLGLAHFAFVTSDLKGMTARLAQAGFAVHKDGVVDEYRANVYYLDPDGFEVEFVQYYNDLPSCRNRYEPQIT